MYARGLEDARRQYYDLSLPVLLVEQWNWIPAVASLVKNIAIRSDGSSCVPFLEISREGVNVHESYVTEPTMRDMKNEMVLGLL